MKGITGERGHDLVVVGAGIVGLTCAWRAAQTGLSVLVIDRGEPGSAASGVAAGMLAPVTETEFGEDELLRLNLAGRAEWPAFAAELAERSGVDLEYRESGALVVAADRDDAAELRRLNDLQRSLGLDARWLGGRECRRLEPGLSPRVAGGVLAPQDAAVDPRAVVRALRAVLEQEGVEIATGVEVRAIEESHGRVTGVIAERVATPATATGTVPTSGVCGAITAGGTVPAARVVVACGAWSGLLHEAAPPIRPVKGQIVRLRGAPLAERVVRTPRCYVVCRPSGEIVVGATVEERGFDTAVTAGAVHRLLEAAWEVLPDVEERELVEVSAGLRPATPGNRPFVGAAGPEGLLWATGHHRGGVLLAPITARMVAAMLTGREAPLVGSAA
ncbi:MAG: glycine oxidase [Thermoleophilaceae bacterium]|nr:glycine oxidase [Thermoleophilaceae bacterium]